MTKATYPTIGIAAFVIFTGYFIGCLPYIVYKTIVVMSILANAT